MRQLHRNVRRLPRLLHQLFRLKPQPNILSNDDSLQRITRSRSKSVIPSGLLSTPKTAQAAPGKTNDGSSQRFKKSISRIVVQPPGEARKLEQLRKEVDNLNKKRYNVGTKEWINKFKKVMPLFLDPTKNEVEFCKGDDEEKGSTLNAISLEITNLPQLNSKFEQRKIVRQMSMTQKLIDIGQLAKNLHPTVRNYLLANSYTNSHFDFGGSNRLDSFSVHARGYNVFGGNYLSLNKINIHLRIHEIKQELIQKQDIDLYVTFTNFELIQLCVAKIG
ncbi:unnamed protein product [Caenorhabditis angaria]|uniref:Uncharacterized protein n=1 Tax=Caenorhabditis angaria TaxID=860376 RepID=A0A9P1J7V5_9PELO|nr:unnamed protein product [Caenorhabditis angaria]